MSNTVPSRETEFLIANLELEFELNHRKQSPLRISNRKYFTIFSQSAILFRFHHASAKQS